MNSEDLLLELLNEVKQELKEPYTIPDEDSWNTPEESALSASLFHTVFRVFEDHILLVDERALQNKLYLAELTRPDPRDLTRLQKIYYKKPQLFMVYATYRAYVKLWVEGKHITLEDYGENWVPLALIQQEAALFSQRFNLAELQKAKEEGF